MNVQQKTEDSDRPLLPDAFFRIQDRLKRVIAGLGLGPTDADDILQRVYLKARTEAPNITDADQATRWLIRVTTNECLLEHRRKRRFQRKAEQTLRDRPKITDVRPEDTAIRKEELIMMYQALQQLDDTLLVPLVLRYFSGMDATEIGKILDLPAATVRSRLRDGRLRLADALLQRGMEP